MNTLRAQFPFFKQHPEQIYLDSAATAQKPYAMIEAMRDYYLQGAANVHRAAYQRANQITSEFEAARAVVADFVNAPDPRSIVWTRGSTEAVNLIAYSYGEQHIQAGDVIVVSALEHHANLLPWQQLCARKSADLRILPVGDDGAIDENQIDTIIDHSVKIVAITAMSNVLGTITPLKKIIDRAHTQNAVVVVDAAQAIVHQTIDVQMLNCDFLVFSAHKLYGPTGLGVLYGKYSLLEKMSPWQTGGEMIRTVTYATTQFQDPPLRFEAGTPAIAEVLALAATIRFLNSHDRTAIFASETQLVAHLENALEQIPGVKRLSVAPQRGAMVSFTVSGHHHADIAAQLDQLGIAVRAGQLCAMPLLQRLQIPGLVRASIGLYSNEDDIETLVAGLKKITNVDCTIRPAETSLSLIQTLQQTRGWTAKQRALLQHGAQQSAWSSTEREHALNVEGCESATWLRVEKQGEYFVFGVDSEARIVLGLAAIVLELVNGKTAQQISAIDFEAELKSLGISGQLSPSRNNGLLAIIKTIQQCVQNRPD